MIVTNRTPIYVATTLPKYIIAKPQPWMHAMLRSDDGYYVVVFVWDTREIIDVVRLDHKPDTSLWRFASDNREDLVDSMHLLPKQTYMSGTSDIGLDRSIAERLIEDINKQFHTRASIHDKYPYRYIVHSITAKDDTVIVRSHAKTDGDSKIYKTMYEYDKSHKIADVKQQIANYILSKLRGKYNFTKVQLIEELDSIY